MPVGGTQPIHVDVRMLAATHSSLRDAVAQRTFRADLMYRIRVVPLFLPPLRERFGDVDALTWRFVERQNTSSDRKITSIHAETLDALRAYDWPGNVRELQNVVAYAFAVGLGEEWTRDELPPELRGEPPTREGLPMTAQDLERERLLDALRASNGNRGEAADMLEISRTTLWRKLREHGIA